MNINTYTVQIPLEITVTVNHDRLDNQHSIDLYDAFDHAYAVIAKFINNHPNVSLAQIDDPIANITRHS